LVWFSFARQLPGHFAQRYDLAHEPGLGAAPAWFFAPVPGLRDTLAIQFKNQVRVAGFEQSSLDTLVAGDASVGAHVEVLQVAHAGKYTIGMCPVGPRVRAQPALCRTMTTFAGDSFARLESFPALGLWNVAQRRMARGAAALHCGVLDPQSLGDLFGARGGESCKRALRVKILQGPDQELILVLTAAAVAGRAAAGGGAEEFRSLIASNGRCSDQSEF